MKHQSKEEKARDAARQRAQVAAARRERLEKEMEKEAVMIRAMEEKLRKQKLAKSPDKITPGPRSDNSGSGSGDIYSHHTDHIDTLESKTPLSNGSSIDVGGDGDFEVSYGFQNGNESRQHFDVESDQEEHVSNNGVSDDNQSDNENANDNDDNQSDNHSDRDDNQSDNRSDGDNQSDNENDDEIDIGDVDKEGSASGAMADNNMTADHSRAVALAKLRQSKIVQSPTVKQQKSEWPDDFEDKEDCKKAVLEIISKLT